MLIVAMVIIPIAGHAQTEDPNAPEFYQSSLLQNSDLEQLATIQTATQGRDLHQLEYVGNDLWVSIDDREINLYQTTLDSIRVLDTITPRQINYDASNIIPIAPDKFLVNIATTSSTLTYLYKVDSSNGFTQLSSYSHGGRTTAPSLALIDNTRVLVSTTDSSRDLRLYVLSYSGDSLTKLSDNEMSTSNYSAKMIQIQGNQFLLIYGPALNPTFRTVSVNNANTITVLDTHTENGRFSMRDLQKTNTDGKSLLYYFQASADNRVATLKSLFVNVTLSGDISLTTPRTHSPSQNFSSASTLDLKITNSGSAILLSLIHI